MWLRFDWSHHRQRRGFTTYPLLWRSRARQCGRMALFGEPRRAGALVNVANHNRLTASFPDRVRDVSSRVPPLKFVQFREIFA